MVCFATAGFRERWFIGLTKADTQLPLRHQDVANFGEKNLVAVASMRHRPKDGSMKARASTPCLAGEDRAGRHRARRYLRTSSFANNMPTGSAKVQANRAAKATRAGVCRGRVGNTRARRQGACAGPEDGARLGRRLPRFGTEARR